MASPPRARWLRVGNGRSEWFADGQEVPRAGGEEEESALRSEGRGSI